jgi:hypothetical protein
LNAVGEVRSQIQKKADCVVLSGVRGDRRDSCQSVGVDLDQLEWRSERNIIQQVVGKVASNRCEIIVTGITNKSGNASESRKIYLDD